VVLILLLVSFAELQGYTILRVSPGLVTSAGAESPKAKEK
jgi:hypothetical protein